MSSQRYSSLISREGRATVPAAARRTLGVAAGNRVQFVLDGDRVTVVSARQMLTEVWANNHAGDADDADDAVDDVRALRHADVDTVVHDGDGRSTEEVTADLLAALDPDR